MFSLRVERAECWAWCECARALARFSGFLPVCACPGRCRSRQCRKCCASSFHLRCRRRSSERGEIINNTIFRCSRGRARAFASIAYVCVQWRTRNVGQRRRFHLSNKNPARMCGKMHASTGVSLIYIFTHMCWRTAVGRPEENLRVGGCECANDVRRMS